MKTSARFFIGFIIIAALTPIFATADQERCNAPCGNPPPGFPPGGNTVTISANDVIISTIKNTATSSSFDASASDQSALTYEAVSNPSNGAVTVSGSTFNYTPTNGFTGQDEFTYKAGNGTATSTPASVSITVIAPADQTPPVMTASSHVVIATSSFSVMPSSAYPTATDDTDTSVDITYEPSTFGPGTSDVTWTARDDAGNESTLTTQITIISPIEVDLPDGCTVTDSGSVEHTYPEAGSPSANLGICALEAALKHGDLSDFDVSNSAFGLSLDGVNGTTAGPTEYWAQWLNDNYTSCGVSCQSLSLGDTYTVVLTDWANNSTENREHAFAFHISSLTSSSTPADPGSNSGAVGQNGGGSGFSHLSFSIPNALAYLAGKQNANGSFSDDRLTDWAAIAYAAADPGAAKQSLATYLTSVHPSMTSTTDYERHAMALEALGINPYSGAGVDYISPIVNAFDGTKVSALVNVNIFALFPLLHAGYSASDEMIQKIVAYILTQQHADGSWSDPDTTAAAIQALTPVNSLPGVSDAITKGRTFLKSMQNANGSIGGQNVEFQTAWALQAIAALGENQTDWTLATYDPLDYLASVQQQDGGVDPVNTDAGTRVWATEYAIPAAAAKPWGVLLMSFAKPSVASSAANTTTTASTTAATSTPATAATSTPAVATSTATVAPVPPAPTPTTAPITESTHATPNRTTATTETVVPRPADESAAIVADAEAPTVAQTAAAGSLNYGSNWFLLAMILIVIFLGILGWSITGGFFSRRR